MTETAVDLPSQRTVARAAQQISQATAVEQSRAIAEVQAAIVVAQQVPRDMDRALNEMRDSCGRLALANRAFYSVPNRGNGPSVHLARELARIWGNLDYGVKELRRDDDAGISEVMAFAWDQQTNVRSTRSFIVPHARMKKVNGQQTREKLVDLGDIYLSNQNVGARAVRECIFTMLPDWLTEEAQDICRRTMEHGEGKPLEQRIVDMIAGFGKLDISVDQIEQRLGRKRGQWTAADVAQMVIVYTSITRDGLDKAEEFPPRRVTASEIAESTPAAPEPAPAEEAKPPRAARMITRPQVTKLHAILGDLQVTERDRKLTILSALISRGVSSSSDLTQDEATVVIDTLDSVLQRDDPQGNLMFILEAAESGDES